MRRRRHAGFTLIELMVVVAIVAIIAAIAMPSYTEQVAKGRRADALRALGEAQLALERWRAENPSYDDCALCTSGTYPSEPVSDYYEIEFTGQSATEYTLTAKPIGAQAGDRCGTYTFKLESGTLTKSAEDTKCSL